MIDESSIKIWTCFSDKDIIEIINNIDKSILKEAEAPLSGK
jgi:hypothetical protein